jgi:hypothetical protein
MAFAYYNRLSKTRQAIYRKSAAVVSVPLADAGQSRAGHR